MSKRKKENTDLRWPWLDKLLVKFKVSDAGRAEVQQILREPIVWLKGEYMVFGQLAPWEKLIFFIQGFTQTASEQWTWGRDRLYRYTYNVNPNMLTVSGIITSLWDAFNDPFIGQWMDRHPMKDSTHRRIVRINHNVGVLMGFFFLFDLGLTPVQRMVMYTVMVCVKDILGTMRDVSFAKFYAGITPYSAERGRAMVWEGVGAQTGYPFGNIPAYILGFVKDRQTWSDYRVYTRGYAITMPLMICTGIIATFVRNRVQFQMEAKADAPDMQAEPTAMETKQAPEEPKLSIKESLAVLKHNKFVIYGTIANLVTMLTPGFDMYPVIRFMFPERKAPKFLQNLLGPTIRGEGYMTLSKQISGIPITFLYPFRKVITDKIGGPKRMMVAFCLTQIAMGLVRWGFGYKSVAALVMMILTDTVNETMGPFNGYASGILRYEMFDYVEYKTGVRSEGITMAFESFVNKIIANNLNHLTGNAFMAWSGIHEIDVNAAKPVVPERFEKYAWPMATLTMAADAAIMLASRMAFPYDPAQKDVIEADLKERRALAQAKIAEIKEETLS